MGIGNIGWTEFLVILAIALVFFGPRRLPGIAQAIGKSLREFQKALNEVKSEMAQAGRDADTRSDVGRILPRPAEIMASMAPIPEDAEVEITGEAEVGATRSSASEEPPTSTDGGQTAEAASPGRPSTSSEGTKAENGDPGDPDVS
jgi:sec-independent protein translocase protein TatA